MWLEGKSDVILILTLLSSGLFDHFFFSLFHLLVIWVSADYFCVYLTWCPLHFEFLVFCFCFSNLPLLPAPLLLGLIFSYIWKPTNSYHLHCSCFGPCCLWWLRLPSLFFLPLPFTSFIARRNLSSSAQSCPVASCLMPS